MKRYYPAFLDLRSKNVLVAGGGEVASRKIKTLLKFGANILAVAPNLNPRIRALAHKKLIRAEEREFKMKDLADQDLVFCATNDAGLNQAISRQCRKKKRWVNVADQIDDCSFIVPSIVQRGDLTIAISTGGGSPALAKYLRKRIDSTVGKEFGWLSNALKKFRAKIVRVPLARRRKILKEILNEKTLLEIREGNRKKIEAFVGGTL